MEITRAVLGRPGTSDFTVVAYDLSALVPVARPGWSALKGHYAPDGARSRFPGWWTQLAGAILVSVGVEAWPEESTLLAWDHQRAILLVRQHAHALSVVEKTLDHIDNLRASALPLVLRLAEQEENVVLTLALDALWHESVRAYRGVSWTYLLDYDVEVTNESFVTDPIWGGLETGLAFSVTRSLAQDDGPGVLDIEVAWCADAPEFELWRCSVLPFEIGIQIEVPRISVRYWRGRVSAAPGSCMSIGLGAGVHCEIEVGIPKSIHDPQERTWFRLGSPRARASAGVGCAEIALALSGSRSGALGGGRLILRGARGRETLCLRGCSPAWASAGHDPDGRAESSAAYDDRWNNSGRIDIGVAPCGSADMATGFDIRISIGEWSGDTRAVALGQCCTAESEQSQLVGLPSARTVVTCRRITLCSRGQGSLSFTGDTGRGPELFTLELQRCSAPWVAPSRTRGRTLTGRSD